MTELTNVKQLDFHLQRPLYMDCPRLPEPCTTLCLDPAFSTPSEVIIITREY